MARRPIENARGDAEIVALLRAATGGLDIHTAAAFGDLARVKELVEKDAAAVNTIDNEGRTPLQLAVKNGHEAVAELLRAHGGIE